MRANHSILTSVVALAMAVSLVSSAQAQHRSIKQSQSGPFAIDYITEGGKFDRCSATLSPGPNMLRIAYDKNLRYAISVPGVPVPAKTMQFYFGSRSHTVTPTTDPARVRAWSIVGTNVINDFMTVKDSIAIDLGAKKYRWPIGRTNLETVMVAVETCTHTAMGR